MAKANNSGFRMSENYLSLALGILVVVVIGALIFNYVNNRSAQNGKTTSTQDEQGDEQSGSATVSLPTKHKVALGDDLWKISEQYYKTGYNWTDIAKVNNLTTPDVLPVDTELTIPAVEPKVLAAAVIDNETTGNAAIEPQNSNTEEAIAGDSYTVVSGDHLWQIAVRAYGDGFKWTEIAEANDLANPDIIHSGNVLKIPR